MMDKPSKDTSAIGKLPERSLAETLKQLRQRAMWIGSLAGSLWGLGCAVLCLLTGVWLDMVLQLSPELRIAVMISALVAGVVVFCRQSWKGFAQGAREWLARRLDEVGQTGGQIVSGVDLAAASGTYAYSSQPALTSGLAQLAIRRATHLANKVPHALALPARPIRRSLAVTGSIVGLVAGLALFLPNLTATELRRFADPFGDHPPYSPISFVVEPGDTQVTYGAGLDIHVTVEGPPVDELELVLRPIAETGGSHETKAGEKPGEESVLMFPDQPGEWRASVSNLTRPIVYFVRSRNARSPRYRIDVVTVPQLAEVLVRIAPPAYTRSPPYEGQVPAAGIAGLPGTQVTISARSNRPLSGGSITYQSGDNRREFPLAPVSSGSDTASGIFPIAGNGRIEVRVVDVAGQTSTEEWSAPVTELVDEQPFVRLIEPRAVSFATPTAVIPVVTSAEDDYGVARLHLFRNLNDSRYLPETLPVASPPPKHVYQVTPLPLELYGLEPGDEIKLFARVEDNDPRGTTSETGATAIGKGAESTVAVIRIISHQQFDQMRRTREGMETLLAKYQQARRQMESLAEEVESLRKELAEQSADDPSTEKLREALQQLAQRLEDEQEMLKKLSQKKHPFPVDEVLNQELERMQQSLQRLQKRSEELSAQSEMTREELEQALKDLAEELRGEREHFDQEAMEPLETLAAVARMVQDESRFVALYRRQRDLADRLKSLRGKDQVDDPATKARMRDLEAEQLQVRLDLDKLLSDIEEDIAKLPEDESLDEMRKSAQEFVAAVRESGAADAMTEAEQGLAEFLGTQGHDAAKEAADILESFLDDSEKMGSSGAAAACRRFQPGMAESMQQTLQQLLQGMQDGSSQGTGMGGGSGGTSAQRNSVGLYGDSPLSDLPKTGDREGELAREARLGARRGAGDHGANDDDAAHDAAGALRASGGNAAAAPLRYRRQVGRYFQRIADELDEK